MGGRPGWEKIRKNKRERNVGGEVWIRIGENKVADDYPLMVERDGKENKKAFELFDNLVVSFINIGLKMADALTMANIVNPDCAKILKDRNWK